MHINFALQIILHYPTADFIFTFVRFDIILRLAGDYLCYSSCWFFFLVLAIVIEKVDEYLYLHWQHCTLRLSVQ